MPKFVNQHKQLPVTFKSSSSEEQRKRLKKRTTGKKTKAVSGRGQQLKRRLSRKVN